MRTKDYNFKFSIIISVFNVEQYMDETMASLLNQDIGFEENVQLIMVDDGSQDSSGKKCDEWAKRYPKNIKVVHKQNGGLASAKNAGLPHTDGKYINFLDPDDLLSQNTLSSVWNFFEANEEEIDIACIPLFMFEAVTGPHAYNDKFSEGTRVIDLQQEWNAVLMSSASSFFHSRIKDKMVFDERLKTSEDFKLISYLLLDKQKLGVVADCKYHYRRRHEGTSLLQQSQFGENWYFDPLEKFMLPLFKYTKEKYGAVPKYIQFSTYNDLRYKFNQSEEKCFVAKDEKLYNKYIKLLNECFSFFDTDVIFKSRNYNILDKLYIYSQMQGKSITKELNDEKSIEILCVDGMKIHNLSNHAINIQKFYIEKDKAYIELFFENISGVMDNIVPFVDIDGTEILGEATGFKEPVKKLKNIICERVFYKLSFNLNKKSKYIVFKFLDKTTGAKVFVKNLNYGNFCSLNELSKSFYSKDNYIVKHVDFSAILIKHTKNPLIKIGHEILYDMQLLKRKQKLKTIFLRWLCKLSKALSPQKEIWLISDKPDKADDNGEALFKYAVKNKKKNQRIYFVIQKGFNDYKRMKKIGKVVNHLSLRHKVLLTKSSYVISAYPFQVFQKPFLGCEKYFRDLCADQKFIFLQHGVTLGDVSKQLSKKAINSKLFITATKAETISIQDIKKYGYTEDEILLSGFPRYDYLYNDDKKIITIAPTWRGSLFCGIDKKTLIRTLIPDFETSLFYKAYEKVLTSKKLLDIADKYGYKIQFLPHSVFFPHIDKFKFGDRITYVGYDNICYRDVFAQTSLLVTDYSSVAFDFAYLKKPVLYYQFDKNSGGYNYQQGYFDFEKDGFGEVTEKAEELVDLICKHMENNCALKDKYKKRIEETFVYGDKNCCEKVFEAISQMNKQ